MAVDAPGPAGGIAALHEEPGQPVLFVGSTTEAELNVLRPPIFPFACWKVGHMRFAFNRFLPQAEMRTELASLGLLIATHSKPRFPGQPARPPLLSVFGHADPTGMDEYNKILSGRRARAIYALLTRRPDMWEQLYSDHEGTTDNWGPTSLNLMQDALGQSSGPPANAAGRQALFSDYMDFLCTPPIGGDPLVVNASDFLGHGSDPRGKADYQGCGEFNPLLLLSRNDEDTLPNADRDERYQVDRRVVVLLFRPETKVDVHRWPCPRATEGVAGCRKRFFSDHEKRLRRDPINERRFEDTGDTFACRFYDRMTTGSPCERPLLSKGMGLLAVRIFFHARPMADLHVRFSSIAGRKIGDPLGDSILSDKDGLAVYPAVVPIGRYVAEVEYQAPKVICTVSDTSEAEVLVLPIRRPYWFVEGDVEFDPDL